LNTSESAARWLRVLTADLASRLMEDEDHRLPRTITIHHRHGGTTKSRQAPLPKAKEMDKEFLFSHAFSVWRGIEAEGRAFPAINISVAVSGFGDVEDGVRGIQGFLVPQQTMPHVQSQDGNGESRKRKRDDSGIAKFFPKKEDSSPGIDGNAQGGIEMPDVELDLGETYYCPRCQNQVPLHDMEVHGDYHVALELSKGSPGKAGPSVQPKAKLPSKEEKRAKKSKPVEKGQRKLEFGI
jgi:DNA polymerase eta